jgi:hypothetical protein
MGRNVWSLKPVKPYNVARNGKGMFLLRVFALGAVFEKRLDHVNQEEKRYSAIIAVCPQIHTKHINTLCGQNVEFVIVKLAVHVVTAGLSAVDMPHCCLKEQRNVTRSEWPHATSAAYAQGQISC